MEWKIITELRRSIATQTVRNLWRMLFLCAVVGTIAGLGAIAFYVMLDLARWFCLEYLAGYHPAHPGGEAPLLPAPLTQLNRWLLFLMPAMGGLVSGFLVYTLAPEAEGHGTDGAIDAYHNKDGRIRARVPIIKAVASAITIGSGGSGGREGPIAQIGSGFGSIFAVWLKLRSHERRILMAAGMGAGVGAIFHAPLAGALFAAEVLYRELDQEYEVIVPAVISSIIAYAIFAVKFGWSPLFTNPGFQFQNPMELLPYFVLALAVAAGSIGYVKMFYGVRDIFIKIHIPKHVKPCIGGLLVGVVSLFLPEAIGTGYGFAQQALFGNVGIGMLLAVGVTKIATTSFTIGSGGSGGVFGPAVVIGAALGGAVGIAMTKIFPGMNLQPGAFAMVGMAGFFAAAANTPISTIIMVSEMTGNYNLLVPSMWVCFIAYMMCKRYTIYENQVSTRFEAPIHIAGMMEAVLKRLSVKMVLDGKPKSIPILVREDTDLNKLSDLFSQAEYSSFPVVDSNNGLVAMISGRELRTVVGKNELDRIIVAADLATAPVTIFPQDNLFKAVKKMTANRMDEICVVDPKDENQVIAILSRSDVITAYHGAISKDSA